MPEYIVWTDVTERKTLRAHGFREAVSKYHKDVGEMPETWNGTLYVRDDTGDERTFRRRPEAEEEVA